MDLFDLGLFDFDLFTLHCIPQHMVEGYPIAWMKALFLILVFVIVYGVVHRIVKSKGFKFVLVGLAVTLAFGFYQSQTATEEAEGWSEKLREKVQGIVNR